MRADSKPTTFNLYAVDWDSVSRMRGAHLDADRVYLEEMLRCALHGSRRGGVVDMKQSYLLQGGATPNTDARSLGIRLERCSAITPQGYLIHWNSVQNPGEGLSCAVDSGASENTVSLYLCIDDGREVVPSHRPQQITDPCRFVRARYRLVARTEQPGKLDAPKQPGELDALKIGQLRRPQGSSQLTLDTEYIPECLRLNSHWYLERRVGDIQQRAQTCLNNLIRQLQNGQFRLETLASPLATASVLVDGAISPYTYLERMLMVLRTLSALHYLLQDEGFKKRVYNAVETALTSIEPNLESGVLDWANALTLIEKTFQILAEALVPDTAVPGVQTSGWKITQANPIRGGK